MILRRKIKSEYQLSLLQFFNALKIHSNLNYKNVIKNNKKIQYSNKFSQIKKISNFPSKSPDTLENIITCLLYPLSWSDHAKLSDPLFLNLQFIKKLLKYNTNHLEYSSSLYQTRSINTEYIKKLITQKLLNKFFFF